MPEEKTVTTRNLVDADLGPLRRFTGVLDSAPTENQTFGEGELARNSTRVSLNYKEIEVIEAVEPYHFPIATIVMSLSNRKKSRWGVFADGTPADRTLGFNNIVDQQYTPEQLDPSNTETYVKPKDRTDLNDCLGKRFGMVLADGEEGRPSMPELFDGREGKDKPTPAWTVYSIEGVGAAVSGGKSLNEVAEDLLDGKTLQEFNKEALANQSIRSNTDLLQSISLPVTAPASFSNILVKTGRFTKDAEGRFHKVVKDQPF